MIIDHNHVRHGTYVDYALSDFEPIVYDLYGWYSYVVLPWEP